MKTVVCILLLALIAGNVQARVTIDADDPNIQYTGRINYADPKAPRMWWPGCDVFANFEMTSSVRFYFSKSGIIGFEAKGQTPYIGFMTPCLYDELGG